MTVQSSDEAARRAERADERADERRMALAREWDELVEQVRGTPGFEDFLRPPGLDDLLPAARGGPVVLVNISRCLCDAVIVTLRGVRVTPLGDLTAAEVQQRAEGYPALLRAVEQAVRELALARRAFEDSAPSLEATLRPAPASRALRQARHAMESGLTGLAGLARHPWVHFSCHGDQEGAHGGRALLPGPFRARAAHRDPATS
ncbi:hypothetical protein [Streptomyces sp. NPDC090036]|uniref:hypothetical protein n=1 Tax=Streptomyces sp. NPDC090036 TaxID=3365926 RepID=UPI0038154563